MKILIPTDFSDNARVALNYALTLFGDEVSELVLLNTWQIPHTGVGMLVSIEDILKDEAEKAMEDLVEEVRRNTHDTQNVRGIVHGGSLVDVVRSMQRSETFDLLVMGTRGADDIRKKVIGSNTSNVVRRSLVPVLVVPDDVTLKAPQLVSLATDFQDLTQEQVEEVRSVVKKFNASFEAVHVEKEPVYAEGQAPKEWQTPFNGDFPKVVQVIDEDVADGIDRYIRESKTDLLAVVRHEYGFFEGLFHSSVSRRLTMYCEVPIMVLPDA